MDKKINKPNRAALLEMRRRLIDISEDGMGEYNDIYDQRWTFGALDGEAPIDSEGNHPCGCIAGLTCLYLEWTGDAAGLQLATLGEPPDGHARGESYDVLDEAAKLLGLDGDQARALFRPRPLGQWAPTAADAARACLHAALMPGRDPWDFGAHAPDGVPTPNRRGAAS